MPDFIVDASVLVKFLIVVNEPYWEEAEMLRDDFGERKVTLAVPALWSYELANTLLMKIKDENLRHQYWASYLQMPFLDFSLDAKDHEMAMRIAEKYQTTYYDASYLYLAEKFHCPLITADEKFIKKVGLSAPVMHVKNYGKKS